MRIKGTTNPQSGDESSSGSCWSRRLGGAQGFSVFCLGEGGRLWILRMGNVVLVSMVWEGIIAGEMNLLYSRDIGNLPRWVIYKVKAPGTTSVIVSVVS